MRNTLMSFEVLRVPTGAAITLISPAESGRVSRPVPNVWFAEFENQANRNEGRVSRPPSLSDVDSTLCAKWENKKTEALLLHSGANVWRRIVLSSVLRILSRESRTLSVSVGNRKFLRVLFLTIEDWKARNARKDCLRLNGIVFDKNYFEGFRKDKKPPNEIIREEQTTDKCPHIANINKHGVQTNSPLDDQVLSRVWHCNGSAITWPRYENRKFYRDKCCAGI